MAESSSSKNTLMAACLRTPQAEQDLLEIWLYIAQDDIAVADKFLDKIEDKCQMLAAHPGTGRLRIANKGAGVDLQRHPAGWAAVKGWSTSISTLVWTGTTARRMGN